MRPTLSVVICAYNAASEIGIQLDALAAQVVDVSWEVVVADNGSDDGTREVLLQFQRRFPVPLRIVDASTRRGVAFARNAAAKASRGQLLAFCDADDRVGAGWAQAVVDALEEFDVAGGVRRELRDPFDPDAPYAHRPALGAAFNGPSVLGNNFALRRAVYFSAGGMDEGMPRYGLDDVELSARLNEVGASFGFVAGMVVYFRPTSSVRAIVRKVYLSGKAEYLVWSYYPGYFPRERSTGRIMWEPAKAVMDSVVESVRSRRPAIRGLARSLVEAAGHMRQHIATHRGKRLPQRQLLTVFDDPFQHEGPPSA